MFAWTSSSSTPPLRIFSSAIVTRKQMHFCKSSSQGHLWSRMVTETSRPRAIRLVVLCMDFLAVCRFFYSFRTFHTLSRNSYIHEIAFVGRDVIGNVPALTADTSSCSGFVVSGGGDSGVTATTLNEGEALGTGTAVQKVKVGHIAVEQSKSKSSCQHTGALVLNATCMPSKHRCSCVHCVRTKIIHRL